MYRVQVEHAGFSPFLSLVEVRSEAPLDYRVTLGVTAVETTVQVSDFDTLLDPHRTGSLNYLGADTLRDRRSSQPGRAVLELVDTQPGWLLEANGVLHPRGSEYGRPVRGRRHSDVGQSLSAHSRPSSTSKSCNP